ncbi:MAG: type II secretion system protein GspD [Candidatus Anammoxibacter sp.]
MNRFKIIIVSVVIVVFLNGCSLFKAQMESSFDRPSDNPSETSVDEFFDNVTETERIELPVNGQPLELDFSKRMIDVSDGGDVKKEPEKLYKFRAQRMDIVTALRLFARSNNLNIVIDHDVEGKISVDFSGLPFKSAIEAIVESEGYYWKQEGLLIRVSKFETKTFFINYLKLTRTSAGSSQATVSGSSGGGGGAASITSSDTVEFWNDLKDQLSNLLSADGKITISRMSGTIHVTDLHRNILQIESFIKNVTESIFRQVEIEARIIEVTLNDQFSLGIDWDIIIDTLTDGVGVGISNIISGAIGPVSPGAPAVKLEYGIFAGDIQAVFEALSEQGELKVVSNPRIRVMNNQPALIKVGVDRPFFESTLQIGQQGNPNTLNETARSITDGLVLSITPQISGDGMVMLEITPIITRLVQTVISPNETVTSPILEIKQTSSVVRVRDGETVTVAGLIQDTAAKTVRKIPLLGDIPILGNMFRGQFTSKGKTELVIFVRPRIIKDY